MKADGQSVPLGEIVRPVSRLVDVKPGTAYRTIGVKWWGEGAYERQTIDGAQTAATKLSIVHAGDLIINKIWVRHGSVAIAGPDVHGCAASNEFPTFELDSAKVLPGWLHWLTKTKPFWTRCEELSQGTSGKNRIKPEKFLTIEIPLPPLAEQRRIVARIEQVAAKVAQARALREAADIETTAMLRSATARAFRVAVPKEASARKDWSLESLPGLPDGWAWSNPEELAIKNSIGAGPFGTIFKAHLFRESGVPIIFLRHVQPGRYLRDKPTFMDQSAWESTFQEYTVFGGELLITKLGTPPGACAIYPEGKGPAMVTPDVIKMKVDTKRALPSYLMHYFNSSIANALTESAAFGSGRLRLTLPLFRTMPVPLPPLSIQREIVDDLDGLAQKVGTIRTVQNRAAAEIEAVLPSVLARELSA